MSFSSDVKTELCAVPVRERHCATAECYGALLYCNTFTQREVKFVTTSREFSQTIVMITHNPEIAQMADCMIRIEDGKIAES